MPADPDADAVGGRTALSPITNRVFMSITAEKPGIPSRMGFWNLWAGGCLYDLYGNSDLLFASTIVNMPININQTPKD